MVVSFCIPTSNEWELLASWSTWDCQYFYFNHSYRHIVVSFYGFNLRFPNACLSSWWLYLLGSNTKDSHLQKSQRGLVIRIICLKFNTLWKTFCDFLKKELVPVNVHDFSGKCRVLCSLSAKFQVSPVTREWEKLKNVNFSGGLWSYIEHLWLLINWGDRPVKKKNIWSSCKFLKIKQSKLRNIIIIMINIYWFPIPNSISQ